MEDDGKGAPRRAARPVRRAPERRFLRLEDVAMILNVRQAQVYALVRSGDLPAIKLGGRGVWRVDGHQLEVYIDRLHDETAAWVRAHPPTDREVPDAGE